MSGNDEFRSVLETVLGQALTASSYDLEPNPLQWSGGLFRFRRNDGHSQRMVLFQLLAHEEYPARFQVTLIGGPQARITLPQLLWDVFDVKVLPSRDHWWTFSSAAGLGDALLEAGQLLVGYGLHWLDGSLKPGRS